MKTHTPIVLTTDFGLSDPYVGVMKGVILTINPEAKIIDLTHQIQPQHIQQASFILGTSHKFFPSGSIHVVVVDPGVGTDRKAVLLITPAAKFLAPDNGVLSQVLSDFLDTPPKMSVTLPVPPQCTAYQLTNPDYWLHPVSNTFHGRDVFAPTAAHLSVDVDSLTVGEPLLELVWLPPSSPIQEGNAITGEVIYADHFGNLITNIQESSIPQSILGGTAEVSVEIKGHCIERLSRTFHGNPGQAYGEPLALMGSNGYLEIVVIDGSAQEILKVGSGEPVSLRFVE
jgi:S-adenosylmethionine hydrolase